MLTIKLFYNLKELQLFSISLFIYLKATHVKSNNSKGSDDKFIQLINMANSCYEFSAVFVHV